MLRDNLHVREVIQQERLSSPSLEARKTLTSPAIAETITQPITPFPTPVGVYGHVLRVPVARHPNAHTRHPLGLLLYELFAHVRLLLLWLLGHAIVGLLWFR